MSRWLVYLGFLALSLNGGAAWAQQLPPQAKGGEHAKTAAEEGTTAEEGKETGEEEEEEEKAHMYSFGDAPASLFFSPEQVTAMKNVLIAVEAQSTSKPSSAIETSTNQEILPFLATKPKVTGEPASYPVFYLSSIFFHDPTDWTVWVNGQRISPKNNKPPLEIAGISPDAVTFRWKPDYMPSLSRRQQEKKFAPVAPVKNRLTARETVAFDTKESAITFTLNPNQSFAAAYMSTFEGKVQPIELESLDIPAAKGTGANTSKLTDAAKAVLDDMAGEDTAAKPIAPAPGNMVDSATVNTLQELIRNQKNFMSAVPHNTPRTAPESP